MDSVKLLANRLALDAYSKSLYLPSRLKKASGKLPIVLAGYDLMAFSCSSVALRYIIIRSLSMARAVETNSSRWA